MKCQKSNISGSETKGFRIVRNYRFQTKSQIWYTDFIMATTMFLLVLVLSFHYITTNYIITAKETNQVVVEADKLSASLVSPGIPANWTNESVVSIGIAADSVLNITKLSYLWNMTSTHYETTKYTLGIKSDFLIYFQDRNGSVIDLVGAEFIGKPGFAPSTVQGNAPENIITITRYLTYKHDNVSDIVGMKVILWQE
ncbi:hypothetical protein JW930_02715 [Candidatus Woesearchaeota archaeon]|nr:hypothetical protein [Candidatus Woesearchaeota archaeon]